MDNGRSVSHKNVLWYIYRALADEMFPIKKDKKYIHNSNMCYNEKIKKQNKLKKSEKNKK